MSAIGTKQTWTSALHMSAIGGKADIDLVRCKCLLLAHSGHWHRKVLSFKSLHKTWSLGGWYNCAGRPIYPSPSMPRSHAPDSIGDCDSARPVRAFMEHRIYRRPLRPAIHRAFDLSGRADGFRRGHHGRDRDNRERPVA